jgi:hypothetical protein
MSERTPLREAFEHKREVKVIHASSYLPEKLSGMQSAPFMLVHQASNTVCFGGASDLDSIRSGIDVLCKEKIFQYGGLSVNGFLIGNGDESTLVITPENLVDRGVKRDNVLAAHSVVWNSNGTVSRAYAGVTSTNVKPQLGYVVEELNGKFRVTSKLQGQSRELATPKNIVFLLNDDTGSLTSTKLSAEQATFQYVQGYTGDRGQLFKRFFSATPVFAPHKEVAARFKQFLEKSNATVSIANAHGQDVTTILRDISAGTFKYGTEAAYKSALAALEKSHPTQVQAVRTILE